MTITKDRNRKLEATRDGQSIITIRESSRWLRPGYTRATWSQETVTVTTDELRKILDSVKRERP